GTKVVDMMQTEDDGIYEVDRIIGRRISLSKQTEYLIFWKGYDLSDCTWSSSEDLDCEETVADFERKCVEIRQGILKTTQQQQQSSDQAPSIDRYENDGVATLIDAAAILIPPGESAFQDAVDDFTFSTQPDEALRNAEHSIKKKSRFKLSATHGWNRKVADNSTRIKNIRGSIRDAAGRIFYLTQWTDEDLVLTWELPDAFSDSLDVLERHETARFLKGRKELVNKYRQMRMTADESIVSPRKPKFHMEKKAGKAQAAVDGMTSGLGGSAASKRSALAVAASPTKGRGAAPFDASPLSITLSDLKNSNLLTDKTMSPAKPAVRTPPASQSRNTPLLSRTILSSDDEAGFGSGAGAKSKSTRMPIVYIDHELGSKNRRYEQNRRAMSKQHRTNKAPVVKPEEDGEILEEVILEGGVVGVVASGKVGVRPVPPPPLSAARSKRHVPSAPSTASTPSEDQRTSRPAAQQQQDTCAVCEAHLSAGENGGSKGGECTYCKLMYHAACYDGVLGRVETEAETENEAGAVGGADSASWVGGEFACVFCARFMGRGIDTYLTWRTKGGSRGVWPPSLGSVDVLIKWTGFSYRHLDWVSFRWLECTKRAASLRRIRDEVRAGMEPWDLAERFDKSYVEPACVLDVKPAAPWVAKKRTQRLEAARPAVDCRAWRLYTDYEVVRVAWRGLGMSESSWESPPSPADDAAEYMAWAAAFQIWQRASEVSLRKHRRTELRRRADAAVSADAGRRLDVSDSPAYLRGGRLLDHQVAGTNWLLERWQQRRPAILADEMGMGKTIQVIAYLAAIYNSTIPAGLAGVRAAASNTGTFPFLVVVPATLVGNWMSEFAKWAPDLVVAQLSGRSADREVQLRTTLFRAYDTAKDLCCHAVVASYEAASNPAGIGVLSARDFEWQAVVVDEGQRLKNDRTKTYAALARFKTRQRVVLTGTPLQNDVRELFSIMSFLDPAAYGSADALHAAHSAETAQGIARIKDLVRPLMLRRTKDAQLALVPPRCELILPVSMTRLQRELYRATLSRNIVLLRSIAAALATASGAAEAAASVAAAPADSSDALATRAKRGRSALRPARPPRVSSLTNILMEVRRIVSHPYLLRDVEPAFASADERHRRLIGSSGKLQLLHALLPELRARGHRMLLFSQFKGTMDILEDYFAAEGFAYLRIDGSTAPSERQMKVGSFNAPASPALVFMASTRTGGLGLNLTSADVVVIFDCDFNPHADLQAMARAHRIGQTKPVTVLKLVMQDSAEERIIKAATRKLVLDHLIIQNIGDAAGAVSNTSTGGDDDLLKPTDVERALRHGASQLFAPGADADAESRAIRYDATRVAQLLDKCEAELRAEQLRVERDVRLAASAREFANSTVSRFARVWTLDAASMDVSDLAAASAATASGATPRAEEEEEEAADVWSRLLEDAAAADSAALRAEADVLSEEIGGRQLRVRKRKVDYAMSRRDEEGPARKAPRPPEDHRRRNQDGDYVVGEAPESDDDDTMSDISPDMPLRNTATSALDPLVKVMQSELCKIIEMHCERLVQCYIRDDDPQNQQQKPYLQSRMNATIAERFISASLVVPEASAPQMLPPPPPSYADPELFFPIPANVRLYRRLAQAPPQQTSIPCWACAAPRHHRDYCPRITDPAFISRIRSIKEIPGFWFSPLYHRFIHWYTYQYIWFILGDPRGSEVNKRNRSANPDYCTNVSIYLHEIRSERSAAASAALAAASPSLSASPPLTPTSSTGPYADTRKRPPYAMALPRNTRWMQKAHGRMLAKVDSSAVSKFFAHMASTDTRYEYFRTEKKEEKKAGEDKDKDDSNDITALREAVKDLKHLRTNSVREMRARIDGWMSRPTSDDLAKASQLLLGTRFIVDRAARTRSALVGKFVIRMSPSVARQETERGLVELLGSQKPALSPAGYENIVKCRQLLLLLLRIKTMCASGSAAASGDGDASDGGAVRYANRLKPIVTLLDVLRQTLVSRMDAAEGLVVRTGGIRASITALHELVIAEQNHLAGNPTVATGLFSSSRSQYKNMFLAEIKKLYSRLKDVTLSGPDAHVLNTPDTATMAIAGFGGARTMPDVDAVNMAAANVNHYQQQHHHFSPALMPAQSAQLQPASLQLRHPQMRTSSSSSAPPLLPYTSVLSRPPHSLPPASSILPSPPSAVPATVAGLPQRAAVAQEADVAVTRLDHQPQPQTGHSPVWSNAHGLRISQQSATPHLTPPLTTPAMHFQQQQQFLMGANAAGAGYSIVSREPSSEISNAGGFRSGTMRSAGSSPANDLVRGGATQSAIVGNAQQLGLSQMSFPNQHQQQQQQQQQPQSRRASSVIANASNSLGSPVTTPANTVVTLNGWHDRMAVAAAAASSQQQQQQQQQAAMLPQRRSSTGSGNNVQQQHQPQQQQIVSQLNQHHHRVAAGSVQRPTYSQMQTHQLPSPVSGRPTDWHSLQQLHVEQQRLQQQQQQQQQQHYAHQQKMYQLQQFAAIQQLQLQQQLFQQQTRQQDQQQQHQSVSPGYPQTTTATTAVARQPSSSSSLVPSTAALLMMMNAHTPTLQTTMMTPFSSTNRISSTAGFVENGNNNSGNNNSESDGGGGGGKGASSSSWDLACALCGKPLHVPSSCGNRTNISALTRRRVEVEMDGSLAPVLKEMSLDTIDKYLKAAFQAP
ncbi:hypothetical protein IWW48_003616, partial [Coemansia sp. RSA 1200]